MRIGRGGLRALHLRGSPFLSRERARRSRDGDLPDRRVVEPHLLRRSRTRRRRPRRGDGEGIIVRRRSRRPLEGFDPRGRRPRRHRDGLLDGGQSRRFAVNRNEGELMLELSLRGCGGPLGREGFGRPNPFPSDRNGELMLELSLRGCGGPLGREGFGRPNPFPSDRNPALCNR